MHRAHREALAPHLLRQPVHFELGVAENHRLRDGQCVVEIAEGVVLPLFSLDRDEELLDPFERKLIALHLGIVGEGLAV